MGCHLLGGGRPGPAARRQPVLRSADGNPEAAFETLGRYQVTHVIVRDDDRVHPDVLARLHLVMQFPGAALYTVPSPATAVTRRPADGSGV